MYLPRRREISWNARPPLLCFGGEQNREGYETPKRTISTQVGWGRYRDNLLVQRIELCRCSYSSYILQIPTYIPMAMIFMIAGSSGPCF